MDSWVPRSLTGAAAVAASGSIALHAVPGHPTGWRVGALSLLCDLAFGIAAVCCLRLGGVRTAAGRAWLLQGLALASYLAAELYTQIRPGWEPVPSPADALWLGFYVLTFASIVVQAHALAGSAAPRTWLDGMVAGLAMGAVAAAYAFGPLLHVGQGAGAEVATGLAYPVADLTLLVLLACTLHVAGHRSRSARLQAAGLAAFLAADLAYLRGTAAGTWVDGSAQNLMWIAGVTLLSASALTWEQRERTTPRPPQLVVPMLSASLAVALLLHGQWIALPPVAIALAASAAALALVRVGLSIEEIRRLTRADRDARFDPLTGLPNRRALAEQLEAATGTPDVAGPSLLLVDIDDFRDINHALGYDAANRVLCAVADRLRALAEPGWSTGRMGGDEFALIVPAGCADPAEVAARVRAEMLQTTNVAGIPLSMSTTVGIATAPDHGTTSAEILARADLALHQAKRRRAHVATFRSGPDEPASPSTGGLRLLAEIRDALALHQIEAHLQPQVDLASGRVVGAEALARWNHPERGLIAPGSFMPSVVRSGLLSDLTARMIEQSAAALVACAERGHPLGVSVNISALDLADDALVGRVERAVRTATSVGGELTLELTEDAVMDDRHRAVEVLTRIRQLGARVSVDDYGTGQASLSYLRDLPLDELKLDRSFVDGAARDPRAVTIVGSTIGLAHDLGLTTVGEGIEDADTAAWLGSIGCDLGQGYWCARPMPLAALLSWLDRAGVPTGREHRDAAAEAIAG